MGSFWHELRRNKKVKLPSRLIFYDCETTPEPYKNGLEKHVLKVGFACHVSRHQTRFRWRETWLKFNTVTEFWNFVESKRETKTKIYLIAHNQNFDFMVVNGFTELVKRGWELNYHIITSNLFIVGFKKKGCHLCVVDSLNWFRSSLASMGRQLGIEKGSIDFDNCTIEELEAYCKNDVVILKNMVLNLIEFIRRYDLGNFQLTAASQTYQAYKHRFMPYNIFIHAHHTATVLERLSYRGGRNEAFFLGTVEGRIFDIDVNSLYPFVMERNDYPKKFIRYQPSTTVSDLEGLLDRYAVCAHVKVKVSEPFIAVKGERLLFPVGTFDVVLTTPELKRVVKYGEILDVKQFAIYEQAPIFKKFVNYMHPLRLRLRDDGLHVFEGFSKVMLNALYGKWGQKTENVKEIGEAPIEDIRIETVIDAHTREIYTEYTFAGKVFKRKKGKGEWRHSFPLIASHVTAYARLYLYDLITQANIENVYYVDTDSLFLNEAGFENLKHLVHESKLGYLKVEKVGKKLTIRGCKDYKLDNLERIKGVKKGAKLVLEDVYQQTRFYKFRSLLRKGVLDAPLTETFTKTLKREYKKGVVGENGRVTPFVLS